MNCVELSIKVFTMKKIYIADDEKNIRDIISSFLANDGYIVKNFETGDDLLKAFEKEASDMVILDVIMPGTDGISLCNAIRKKSNVPIVLVSAKDSELDRITGITMGGDDYLVKPFSPLELVARVKSIFRRIQLDSTKEEKNISFGNISLNLAIRTCTVNEAILDLTPTEFSLLVYMFKHRDRAISREELLEKVWNLNADVCTRATDDVLKRLRKKISISNVKISSVWGFGFKLEIA